MSASRSKIWIGGIVVVAVAAVAVGLAVRGGKSTASASGPYIIKTWTRKDCSVTPWAVAEKKGFFTEENIKLELTGETQPALQIPSILRGDNDVASFHPNTIAVAKAGGAQITGVAEGDIDPSDASVDPKYRHMWWYVNPDKHPDIHSFADLAKLPGKLKVSTITNNICADFETNLLADRNGIPREKIEWISMPDIQAIQALKQGLVDVSEVHPPFYKGMADAGARKIADSFETGLGPAGGITYYVFRDDFIKSHPKEIAAFTRAIIKAQTYAVEHPEEAIKITEEAIGVPVTGNHYYSKSLKVNENLADPWIKDLVASKVIPPDKVTTATLVTHDIEKIIAQAQ
jgi:ABC-type nitrate/sulfonate/bicarbonate transport system substrate-binding protein